MNKPVKQSDLKVVEPLPLLDEEKAPAIARPSNIGPDNADDFDWSNDDSIILKEQRATAVYKNREGEIVIRQRCWPDEDAILFINPDQAVAFMEGMSKRVREG
jgi:hypothetical protein